MNSGVELAEKIGMTPVTFARSPNLYVYDWSERSLSFPLQAVLF
jgi:formate dehydrogenase assembly factor FdhD